MFISLNTYVARAHVRFNDQVKVFKFNSILNS